MRNYRKGKDYTRPITIILLLVLAVLGSRSPMLFRGYILTQTESSKELPVQDMGPTEDGSTSLEVANSIPYPMRFRISAKGGIDKNIKLDACSNCRIYRGSSEIPENIRSFSPKQLITVSPGRNFIIWSYDGGNISAIQAYWELKQGHKYSIGPVMDMTQGRSNWDSVK
jgi:hypothetical protein